MKEPRPFSERFVVRGLVAKDATALRVKAGTCVYLRWTYEGGGWFQWETQQQLAYPFADQQEAAKAASGCPGPWYLEPEAASIEVVSATYYPPLDAQIILRDAN